jgi:hypothetical protein
MFRSVPLTEDQFEENVESVFFGRKLARTPPVVRQFPVFNLESQQFEDPPQNSLFQPAQSALEIAQPGNFNNSQPLGFNLESQEYQSPPENYLFRSAGLPLEVASSSDDTPILRPQPLINVTQDRTLFLDGNPILTPVESRFQLIMVPYTPPFLQNEEHPQNCEILASSLEPSNTNLGTISAHPQNFDFGQPSNIPTIGVIPPTPVEGDALPVERFLNSSPDGNIPQLESSVEIFYDQPNYNQFCFGVTPENDQISTHNSPTVVSTNPQDARTNYFKRQFWMNDPRNSGDGKSSDGEICNGNLSPGVSHSLRSLANSLNNRASSSILNVADGNLISNSDVINSNRPNLNDDPTRPCFEIRKNNFLHTSTVTSTSNFVRTSNFNFVESSTPIISCSLPTDKYEPLRTLSRHLAENPQISTNFSENNQTLPYFLRTNRPTIGGFLQNSILPIVNPFPLFNLPDQEESSNFGERQQSQAAVDFEQLSANSDEESEPEGNNSLVSVDLIDLIPDFDPEIDDLGEMLAAIGELPSYYGNPAENLEKFFREFESHLCLLGRKFDPMHKKEMLYRCLKGVARDQVEELCFDNVTTYDEVKNELRNNPIFAGRTLAHQCLQEFSNRKQLPGENVNKFFSELSFGEKCGFEGAERQTPSSPVLGRFKTSIKITDPGGEAKR